MILLDTCSFLWMTSDPSKLSKEAKRLITKHAGEVFVSSISAFEIGIKAQKGQLDLPLEIHRWFSTALKFHDVTEIPVNAEIAGHSTQLPSIHRDPCDRMIISTSQIHDFILLTPDPLIRQYPQVKTVW